MGPLNIGSLAKPGSWERTHLSVVTRVGIIVAVAIACVIVAVLTSAYRADEVALEQERQLFTRAIADHGGRVLREVESVTATDRATHNIRVERNLPWVQHRIGQWLETYFDHEFVFVIDEQDRFLDSRANLNRELSPEQQEAVPDDLKPLAAYLRGRSAEIPHGTMTILRTDRVADIGHGKRMAVVQRVGGKPAFVAVTEIRLPGQDPATLAPFVMAVKFLDADVLSEISGQLQLPDLRAIGNEAVKLPGPPFELLDDYGQTLARFAWTPKQPGSRIMRSVIPFVAVAVAGFGVLALFILRYMRRTAAAIAAGEDRLRHLALHDPLCGLPNRTFFGERLEAVISDVQAGGPQAAVFYIDLDHFKDVNDTLGHPVGDELIRNVTLRLNRILRGKDLVARLGGDEFAVITSSGPDAYTLQGIAGRIISSISAPYSINGQNIVIGASLGIAVIDQRTKAAADIMRYADIALYRAKNEGRKRACIYDAAMDEDLSSRKLLEADLREAIENGGLYLAYQPVVNNSGEKVVGVEALARWNHPERGDIRPAEFIPVAEDSGLITALGEWVLRRACLDGKSWPGTTVSVNVSPLQFRRTDFVDMVKRILAETQFDAARLELEVTESTFLGNVATAEAAMRQLKNLGVQLALDDFGTGYSSLLYLRRFPFDKLKIDQSFTASIETAADAAAIVHAIVSLGRGLGMKVTAEGVETAEQALFLRAAGVHAMQGFRYGKPMSAAAISVRLASSGRRRPPSDIAIAG
ncbi:MAG TPA: EAL domain-containing protein [Xanthobacteraceae bacterium]|nr:EAL domain-containing protein [Xanthobacteraceae bacterium]